MDPRKLIQATGLKLVRREGPHSGLSANRSSKESRRSWAAWRKQRVTPPGKEAAIEPFLYCPCDHHIGRG